MLVAIGAAVAVITGIGAGIGIGIKRNLLISTVTGMSRLGMSYC